MSPGRAALYMTASVLMFITQGLGMNLINANIYQLQGTLSATTNELAWLSAAYMAPYASMSVALFKIRTRYGLRPFTEIALICFVIASIANLFVSDLHSALDSSVTRLTRPEQMYLSQALVAAGAAMFLPPAMAKGFAAVIA